MWSEKGKLLLGRMGIFIFWSRNKRIRNDGLDGQFLTIISEVRIGTLAH
jgi:hypothetical protein